jgi:hypothetical protein
MTYELLTGNEPNVSYFRVFKSKFYILVKKGRHSKFAPKVVEGFLLGYDSNTKAYRVNPSQEPPLLATSVCLVLTYAMPCDHFGLHVPCAIYPNP